MRGHSKRTRGQWVQPSFKDLFQKCLVSSGRLHIKAGALSTRNSCKKWNPANFRGKLHPKDHVTSKHSQVTRLHETMARGARGGAQACRGRRQGSGSAQGSAQSEAL